MNRTLVLSLSLFTVLIACNEASDLQHDANTAQNDANNKIADVRSDAGQDIRAAQADADKKIASAQEDFSKMREDYRHEMTLKLADLDKKVADLEAKASTINGQAKTDLQANLVQIQTYRTVFVNDYKSLDNVSGASWDATKARLDREWSDLSTLVDKA